MADDRFCRFATKIVANGVTLVDGVMSVPALDVIGNHLMHAYGLPMILFRDLYAKPAGHHVHFDITVNGNFVAIEVAALSDPVTA